jgi:hypothetical protein
MDRRTHCLEHRKDAPEILVGRTDHKERFATIGMRRKPPDRSVDHREAALGRRASDEVRCLGFDRAHITVLTARFSTRDRAIGCWSLNTLLRYPL